MINNNFLFHLGSALCECPCDLKCSSTLPASLFSSPPCQSVQNTSMRRHNRLLRHRQFALGRLWHWASWLNGRINLLQHAPPSLGFACLLSFLYWGVWFAGNFSTTKKELFFIQRLNLNAVWVFDVLMTVKSALPTLKNKPPWDLVRLLCTDGIKVQKTEK